MWDGMWSSREKMLALAVAVLTVVLIGVLVSEWTGGEEEPVDPLTSYSPMQAKPAKGTEKKEPKESAVVVDVKGAVKHPGVYRLSAGARVKDALEEAGGPVKQADIDQVNLAQPLTDGMVVRIPRKGEREAPLAGTADTEKVGTGSAAGNGAETININTAGVSELEQLNGIGPSKAEAIVRYREENGPFSSVEELIHVPGIGEKTLENLRDQVTVQ